MVFSFRVSSCLALRAVDLAGGTVLVAANTLRARALIRVGGGCPNVPLLGSGTAGHLGRPHLPQPSSLTLANS